MPSTHFYGVVLTANSQSAILVFWGVFQGGFWLFVVVVGVVVTFLFF